MYLYHKILLFIDKLFKKSNLDYGFMEVKPKKEDFIHKPDTFGFVSKVVLFPDAQSDFYRPTGELQKRGDKDKMSCVTGSGTNCIEIIINYFIAVTKDENLQKRFQPQDLYEIKEIIKVFEYFELIKDGQANCSDRHIAKLGGTTERGANQNTVAQAIHKYGLVPEDLWPYVSDWNEYYKTIPNDIIKQGKKILDFIEINHEWVHPKNFNSERRFGPIQTSICVSGDWWNSDIYPKQTYPRNHAIALDSYVWQKYDQIFDTYKPFNKRISWYSNLGWGKLFSIHLVKPLNIYNENKIQEVKKKWDYVVLVENYKTFTKGIYKLNDKNIEKIEMNEAVDKWVATLKEGNKIEGVNADFFSRLIT